MKKLIILICLFFIAGQTLAQKEDNVWVFGYDSNTYPEHPGTERISFHFDDSLRILYTQGGMPFFDTNATFCDSSGELVLLSNGCYVETGSGIYVENSYGLNPGYMGTDQCYDDSTGYNVPQSMTILRDSENGNLLHIFHIRHTYNGQVAFLEDLLHSLVDISANNGQGETVFKNQILVKDSIDGDGIHAVRHANGRDWWIVVAKYLSNTYHIILLSPWGLATTVQSIGRPSIAVGGAYGEMAFSPDGSKLARFNTKDDLQIFDFDRCAGIMSNPIFISIQDETDNYFLGGLAWSADGHYLYAAEIKRLLQFDMWASDIASSKVIIAEATPPVCPLSGTIGFLELGPDGMIYSSPLNGQKCMHRIKHPERGGAACELEQNYYQLDISYSNFPHFPNFRLGPIDSSSCDTLGINNHPLAGWRYDRTGGTSVDFTSVSWYEPDAWLWDFGDGTQSTERNPAHVFPGPGAYEVCLQVSNQYGSDTKCKTVWVTTVGTGSPEGETAITLFPNPATNTVYWRGTGSELIHFKLFNHLGQVKLSKETDEGFAQLSSIIPGFYTVQILSQEGTLLTAQRFIIQ